MCASFQIYVSCEDRRDSTHSARQIEFTEIEVFARFKEVVHAYQFRGLRARIALSPSIRFGIGGVIFLYVIQPLLDRLAAKMKDKTVFVTAVLIVTVLAADLVYTVFFR